MNDHGSNPDAPAASDLYSSPATIVSAPDAPGYGELRRSALSLLLGMGSFYGARYLGADALAALMISTIVSATRVGYAALRIHRLDLIAAFLLAADGITLVVGLLSRSAVTTMFGQHIPGIIFGVFLIASLIRNRPATEVLVDVLRPGWLRHHIANHAWTENDAHAYHRTHVRLTLVVTTAHLLHLTAATIVILTLSVDIAKGLLGVLALTTNVILLITVLGGIGAFLRRRQSSDAT